MNSSPGLLMSVTDTWAGFIDSLIAGEVDRAAHCLLLSQGKMSNVK